MVQYLYNGILPHYVAEQVPRMMREYGFVLEVRCLPEYSWFDKNFKRFEKRTASGHPDGTTVKYACLSLSKGSDKFLFIENKEDYNAFVEAWPEFIANDKPFQTICG